MPATGPQRRRGRPASRGGAGGQHPSGRLSGVRVSYSLATVARDLGQLRKEGDRLLILRLLLFTLSYCMDKIPAAGGGGGGLPFSSLAEGENPGLYPARLRKVSDNMVQLPELSTGDSSYPSMSGCGGGGGGSSRSSLKNGSGPVQSSRQGSLVDTLGHQAPKASNRKSNGENHNRETANRLTHAQNDGCKATMQTYHSHESSLSMTQVEEIVEGYLPASPPIQSKDQSSDSATSSFGIQRQQYHTHHPQTDATNNMKNHGNGVFWGIHKHPSRSSQEDCGTGELGEQSNAAQQKIAQSFLRQQSSCSEDKEKEQEGEDKEGEGALLTDGEAHHNQHQHFCSSVPPHDNTSNRVIIRKRFSLQELSRQRLKTAVDAATLMQTRAKSTVCLVS
uniref:Uncharacterized protein n=1 Tax=Heterosigma akashiwo TaxID=2829 RepID=A0A7S3XZI5_HETAK